MTTKYYYDLDTRYITKDLGATTITNPTTNAAVTTAIVDAYSGVIITLTSAGAAQTIQDPTDTTSIIRFIVVADDANTSYTSEVNGITLSAGEAQWFIWDGSAWIAVTATDADNIAFTPSGDLVATNVQSMGEELDTEKEPRLDRVCAIYVGKHGNDTKDGLTPADAKLTFAGARATIVTATDAAADHRYVIWCEDAGIYAEDLVGLAYVDIWAPRANINTVSTHTIVDDVSWKIGSVTSVTGDIAFTKSAGSGDARIKISHLNCEGTSNGVLVTSGGLTIDVKQLSLENGYGIGGASSSGNLHVNCMYLHITGTGTGIGAVSAGCVITGTVGCISKTGAGSGTGIYVGDSTAKVNLVVGRIGTTIAWNVAAAGTLNIHCPNVSGTRTETGTVNKVLAGVAIDNTPIGQENAAAGSFTPLTANAPAKLTTFTGTVSAATRTATFSETADYDLCKVGSTLIADGDTRIVVALLGSDQVTVDANTSWTTETITSLQDPISQEKDADGTVVSYVNALGGVGSLGGTNSLQKGIAFGDGDTGFYESYPNKIYTQLGGSLTFVVETNYIRGAATDSGTLINEVSSSINPTFSPSRSDHDTGIGRAAEDQLSLISGGVEGQRIIEANSIIYNLFGVTQLESVTDATTNGTTTVTKAGTNFTTKCAANNIVLFYGGTTTADYGIYTVVSVADGSLVLDRAPSGSVSDMDFYVLSGGLITTGGNLYADKEVHALLDIVTHSATENVTAATMKGSVHKITGAYVVTLPAAVVGMSGVFRASTAAEFSVKAGGSDHFEMFDGTVISDADKITSGGTKNEFLQIYCESANTWIVIAQNGPMTDGGA